MLRRCTRSQQTKGSSPGTEGGREAAESMVGEDPRAAAVNICPGIPRPRRVRRHPPPRFPYNAIHPPRGDGLYFFPFFFSFFFRCSWNSWIFWIYCKLRFTADSTDQLMMFASASTFGILCAIRSVRTVRMFCSKGRRQFSYIARSKQSLRKYSLSEAWFLV